jgi:hypothetical protein
MYSNNDIEIFLKKIIDRQNGKKFIKFKTKNEILFDKIGLLIPELTSEIDKNILKDLINQKIDYRHKVIRLIAEICKDGKKIENN